MKVIPTALLLCVVLITSLAAPTAQAAHLGTHADLGFMALTNSSDQGGNGPSGSSILSQGNIFYNFPWVGVGIFFQLDKQGSVETDFLLGPKMEFHYGPLFVDAGYAIVMSRAFNDRSIASQSGKGAFAGLGVRIYMKELVEEASVYFQVSYRFRSLSVTEQDGSPVDEPILQVDSYPLFSVGYAL